MKLKDLKKGEFFSLKPCGERQVSHKEVYTKGEYDRSLRKYECCRNDDVFSHYKYLKGDTEVYTDFVY